MDEKEWTRLTVLNEYEERCYRDGCMLICGIDEVGRGPLAGPVVAACVIFPRGTMIEGIDDSKKIPKSKHGFFYDQILGKCIDHSIGMVQPSEIDDINILNATKKAMEEAVKKLRLEPDMLLIDHLSLDNIRIRQMPITKGDSLSVSIAAASLIAKYTRDNIMKDYSKIYPHYHFDKNSGYGTRMHIEAIQKYGICEIHRRSFIKKICVTD